LEKIKKPIWVTQPSLPPLKEFIPYLEDIWERKWITNNGYYHQEFEKKLAEYLGVKYISLVSNGTLALIIALKALDITGEVITTPYSFVATSHALKWNGIEPVFCDIEPNYCTLDPQKIEAAISPMTTAILPVHVYGNPCNVEEIKKIADKYGLKVIYDAAHAFGVKIGDNPIVNFGDISVLSFHATKIFTTFEGGAIVCHDKEMKARIDFLRNFGFADEITVIGIGINAKMNELQAAFGLLSLKYIQEEINKRKAIAEYYRRHLEDLKGIKLIDHIIHVEQNYSYFPVFINEKEFGCSRDQLFRKLKEINIHPRRYFYPLISQFSAYRDLPSASSENLPVAEQISQKVLCLPIYSDLDFKTQKKIIQSLQDF